MDSGNLVYIFTGYHNLLVQNKRSQNVGLELLANTFSLTKLWPASSEPSSQPGFSLGLQRELQDLGTMLSTPHTKRLEKTRAGS